MMLQKLFDKKKLTANRVLIVEDDAMLSGVLAENLEAAKFKVAIVTDGLSVFDEVLKFSPDIILLDLVIPGIDGFMVLKQLKEDSKTSDIPVAVLSNLGQESDVKSVKALGADQYFLKANTRMDLIIKYVKDKLKD